MPRTQHVMGRVAQGEVRDGPCHAEPTGHRKECGPFQEGEGQDLMFVCLFVCLFVLMAVLWGIYLSGTETF